MPNSCRTIIKKCLHKGAINQKEYEKLMRKIDAVEVVRCKDCEHHIKAPKTTDVWCERVDGLLQGDWFCADGERREDAEIH